MPYRLGVYSSLQFTAKFQHSSSVSCHTLRLIIHAFTAIAAQPLISRAEPPSNGVWEPQALPQPRVRGRRPNTPRFHWLVLTMPPLTTHCRHWCPKHAAAVTPSWQAISGLSSVVRVDSSMRAARPRRAGVPASPPLEQSFWSPCVIVTARRVPACEGVCGNREHRAIGCGCLCGYLLKCVN